MKTSSLLNGHSFVVDAMVIINFHSCCVLDKLSNWLFGRIIIAKEVKREIIKKPSLSGSVNLEEYLKNGAMIEREIEGEEQEELFYEYYQSKLNGTSLHVGEAACLALAILTDYGLLCDEKIVLNEFKSKCPQKVCMNSWGLIGEAVKVGLIEKKESDDLKKGFYWG